MRAILSLFVLIAIMAVLLFVPRECQNKRKYPKDHESKIQQALQELKNEEANKVQAAKDYLAFADDIRKFSPSLSIIPYMNSLYYYEKLHTEFFSKPTGSSDANGINGRYLDDVLNIRNEIIPDVRMEALQKASHNLTELILYLYAVPRSIRFSTGFPYAQSVYHDISINAQINSRDGNFLDNLVAADNKYGDTHAGDYIGRFQIRWAELDQKYPPEERSYSYKEPEPDPTAVSTLDDYATIAGAKDVDDLLHGILIERIESEYAKSAVLSINTNTDPQVDEEINVFTMSLYGLVSRMNDWRDDFDISLITLIDQLNSVGLYDDADKYLEKLLARSDSFPEYPGIYEYLKSITSAGRYSAEGNYDEANRILDELVSTLDMSIFAQLPLGYFFRISESYKKTNNPDKYNQFFENVLENNLLYNLHLNFLRAPCCRWLSEKGEYLRAIYLMEIDSYQRDEEINSLILYIITEALRNESPDNIVRYIERANYSGQRVSHLSHLWREIKKQGIDYDAKSVFQNSVKDVLRADNKYSKVKYLLTIANAYIEDGNTRDARSLLGKSQRIIGGWLGIYRSQDINNLINIARLYNKMDDKRNCEKILDLAWKTTLSGDKYSKPADQKLVVNKLREMGFDNKADKYNKKIQRAPNFQFMHFWVVEADLAYIGYPVEALEHVLTWEQDFKYSDLHIARCMALSNISDVLLAYGLYDEAYTAIYEQSISDPLMGGDRAYSPDGDFRKGFVMRFAEIGRFDLAFKAMSMMTCDVAMQKAAAKVAKCMREQNYEMTEDDKQCLRAIVHQDPFFVKYKYEEIRNAVFMEAEINN